MKLETDTHKYLLEKIKSIKDWSEKPNWRITKEKIDELYLEILKTEYNYDKSS